MSDNNPRRHLHTRVKGDRWIHQTVRGHISAPVTSQSGIIQQRTRGRNPRRVSASIANPSDVSQQEKRRAHHAPAESGRRRRQKVEAERPSPAQSLIDAYKRRQDATCRFPLEVSARDIRASVQRYEQIIQDAWAEVENSCASCGEFGAELVSVGEDRLHSMETVIGVPIELDDCGFVDGSYLFCKPCLNALNNGRIPKFSAMNAVNVTMCQHYPKALEDLNLVEEYAIARSHPIGTILKLKPNGVRNPTAYNGIRGHIVTIPQNPGPLLNILPSPDLQFYDHIRIVWAGKAEPTADDLKPFVEIRKEKVLRALLWLCQHNPLYKSVKINHELINQWAESHIPPLLQDSVVNVPEDRDSDERGTYAGDMEGLFENDLHSALDGMADGTIASGVVYSDVEGQRQIPELKMVTALMSMMDKPREGSSDTDAQQVVETPVITWTGNGQHVLMNDYEDAEFFTGAFPTLFPYGKGGHMPASDERGIAVSLEAWGEWLMKHHSRR